jgi:hypothetical protein
LIDLTANILIHIIHGDDQIFEMVCCRIQPRIRLSSIHQLIEPIDVVPWGGILLLYAGYINQGILDADGLFKPLQLILIPFGYDLDPAIIQVLDRPLNPSTRAISVTLARYPLSCKMVDEGHG